MEERKGEEEKRPIPLPSPVLEAVEQQLERVEVPARRVHQAAPPLDGKVLPVACV
jgi:hypothetical protein